MMELGDYGIKEPEDIIKAIQSGSDYAEVMSCIKIYGDRFTPMVVSALILMVNKDKKEKRI